MWKWKWKRKKKKKPAEGDHEQPGACDDIESTRLSPKEGHAIFPDKGTAVAYSMEAQEAPAEAANGTAVAKTAHHFTYNEILQITGKFGRVIGEGDSATVYYGQLQEGGRSIAVAVKKIKDSSSPYADLLAEVKIMKKIHHRNLVSLVGLCQERDEIILVSEYMAGGSLFEILKARRSELTWRKRLQIALEAATGLEYLHTGCKPAVIHKDIKSTNILLDENLEAKLADFGLSKAGEVDRSEHSAYQTKVFGMGYIDPEYLYTQTLTKKSDVYSFGVVLFELITGRPAIVITESNEKLPLTNWVMPMLMRGELESLLDPLLKGHCNIVSVWEIAGVAKTATQHPSGRPDMSEIVSTMKAALRMETSRSTSEAITSQSSVREVPLNPVAKTATEHPSGRPDMSEIISTLKATLRAETSCLATGTRHFTYNDILKITRNFARVIGEGGSAIVYYGELQEGGRSVEVAVKKIKDSGSQFGDLLGELKILMKIRHKNLVSLVGLCEERDEIILMFEYMASGSLLDLLKGRTSELTWRKRLQIALDVATGLEYLHTGCKPAVIHRDIKSTNILLDENLEAKLADFGLSKSGAADGSDCSAFQTKVAGTLGYIDPEYYYTQTLTKKSDVYSFGVVLFELITGKPAVVITESNERCHLTKWVLPRLVRGDLESLLDPFLKGRCNINSVWEVVQVAKTATEHPSERPDMWEIISTLKATLRAETSCLATGTRHFTYNDILKITRNFARVIGEGGSAIVYYGELQEGGRSVKVAVKKIKDSGSQFGDLLGELKILMKIRHKNLVSLVGLCEERDEIILMFEYMASGSLLDLLKGRTSELTWRKRLQIALDVATGLEYLHTGCKPAVIHRDIKSTNILLDENLEAKLADFGLSKSGAADGSYCSAYQTKVAGTLGYIDPEYYCTLTLTKKSDVFSFGVVLFELITGKPAIVITESKERCHLTNWVRPMLMRGELESLVDPLLKGHCNIDSIQEVAEIAKAATQYPSGRPDMPEIVSTLKAALRVETLWLATAPRHFTYNEILNITQNFGQVIGEGRSATVYYGQLQEGGRSVKVAVKKIKDSGSQFGNLPGEVKILMKIRHRNLVSLVGLCKEQDEIILVFEYMASGSLFDILKARTSELTWRKRLQIALDAATGLEYLHTGCKPEVIHRDIKSTNILLNENLEAKLADFGLSKAGEYSAYQTKVAGTCRYIDPEYYSTQTLTKKSDVYSFGVVLFELITGKPAIVNTESNERCHLTKWVMPTLVRGELESLLDPFLKGHCNIDSVWQVAGLATSATQHSSGRPDMPKIVSMLKAALRPETSWSVSDIITSESSFREISHNPVAR